MVISPNPIRSTFVKSIQNLDSTKPLIENYFTTLQEKIKFFRKANFSLISNSNVSLYNDLISLYYRINLQTDNCHIYLKAIEELDSIDSSFHLQLTGLLDTSKELTSEFLFLQTRYNSSFQKQRVINA